MVKILMEFGVEPTHIVCNNGSKKWDKAMKKVLESSPYGANAKTYPGADLWHLRSLCFTDKPDFIIGSSYGKYIQRDTLHKGKEFEVPLIRIGFPLFDRHHLHRQTTIGYEGAMQVVTTLVNAVLEKLDTDTMGSYGPIRAQDHAFRRPEAQDCRPRGGSVLTDGVSQISPLSTRRSAVVCAHHRNTAQGVPRCRRHIRCPTRPLTAQSLTRTYGCAAEIHLRRRNTLARAGIELHACRGDGPWQPLALDPMRLPVDDGKRAGTISFAIQISYHLFQKRKRHRGAAPWPLEPARTRSRSAREATELRGLDESD
jgi:hypothetical protein